MIEYIKRHTLKSHFDKNKSYLMPFQFTTCYKCGGAIFTYVGSLPSVGHDVELQLGFIHKGLQALPTLVRFDRIVVLFMSDQLLLGVPSLAADVTDEGSSAEVGAVVPVQLLDGVEASVASGLLTFIPGNSSVGSILKKNCNYSMTIICRIFSAMLFVYLFIIYLRANVQAHRIHTRNERIKRYRKNSIT